MAAANMLNTVMPMAHDLLLNTCFFFLMSVCVITGAIARHFVAHQRRPRRFVDAVAAHRIYMLVMRLV